MQWNGAISSATGWGDHQFRIQEDGSLKLGSNFLVRTAPMFAEKGYRVVIVESLEYDDFLKWLPLENIRYPVLLVHHRNDECKICSFYQAMKLRDVLRKTTKVDFVEVSGGRFPDTGPCQPLSPHGYYGKEEKVVETITLGA